VYVRQFRHREATLLAGRLAVRPNPSLNTGPSAAGQLAREAPAVYVAPRGQAAPPLLAG
jgi:hypothetical protein